MEAEITGGVAGLVLEPGKPNPMDGLGLGSVNPDSVAIGALPTSGLAAMPPTMNLSQVLRADTTSQIQPSKTPSGAVNDMSMGRSMGLASIASDGEAGEDPFAGTENNMSDEDRNKAVAWAAAAADVEHVGFLPAAVLKQGFRIKIFKLWVPLQISIDYQNRRLTFVCPDTIADVLMRKTVAHRVDMIDVKAETPVSNKQKPGPTGRPATTRSSSGATGTNEVQHFSKRRVNLVRVNGGPKYRLIAPSTEYRDRFLDVMFMMSRPANPMVPVKV
ncbi:hypothetical protein RvY_11454 [Ramazzottius varieornatus]|uniref:Uncharacterized protein n=1 Tax=Ramazzottius varieornatus TaxID=947166 RepID=A0A1D1VI88_RAMVA|nr:hypothetical protein RvY_11454 [Ramazzottius varieornatus]